MSKNNLRTTYGYKPFDRLSQIASAHRSPHKTLEVPVLRIEDKKIHGKLPPIALPGAWKPLSMLWTIHPAHTRNRPADSTWTSWNRNVRECLQSAWEWMRARRSPDTSIVAMSESYASSEGGKAKRKRDTREARVESLRWALNPKP